MICIVSLPSLVHPYSHDCIVWLHSSLLNSYWAGFVLFLYPYRFICIGPVCIVSFHVSLVLPCWICIVLFSSLACHTLAFFHFILLWFIITEHGLYCFTSCFIVFSLLSMVYIFPLQASMVRSYWTLFVLLHFKPHWFIIIGHCLYCFTLCLTCSSLLGMVCVVSRHASLVHHYLAWFVLFHFMLHWFIRTGHCVYFPHFPHDFYCFTSLTGSSSLGMVCIVWLRASLVDPYCAWFVLSHFMLHWFFNRGHGLCCFTSCFIGSSLLGMVCIV